MRTDMNHITLCCNHRDRCVCWRHNTFMYL